MDATTHKKKVRWMPEQNVQTTYEVISYPYRTRQTGWLRPSIAVKPGYTRNTTTQNEKICPLDTETRASGWRATTQMKDVRRVTKHGGASAGPPHKRTTMPVGCRNMCGRVEGRRITTTTPSAAWSAAPVTGGIDSMPHRLPWYTTIS